MSYDIPSISELEKIHLLNIHYAEIVTSKAGGIESGADITTSTNPITGVVRRTMYKVLDDMSGTYGGSFTTGFTVLDRGQVFYFEDGDSVFAYSWVGNPLNITASAGSNPSMYGLVGKDWIDRNDALIRKQLMENSGSTMVRSSTGITVEQRLVDIESRSTDLETIKPELIDAAEAIAASVAANFDEQISTRNGSLATEGGRYPVETIEIEKKVATNFEVLESINSANAKSAERVFYGKHKFEPYHPSEFPVDFTPNAPSLLIGSQYTTDPAYTERVYQGCPSAAKTGDRLWCGFRGDIQMYDGGEVAEHTGNFVTLCTSTDNGATWSEYGYIRYVDDPTRGVFEPVMWVAPDGKLWIFVTVDGDNTPMDGVFGGYALVCKNPESLNAVYLQWETPVKIFPFGFLSGTPVDVDGKILMPTCYWEKLLTHYPVYPQFVGKNIYELDWKNKKAFLVSTLPDAIDTSSFDENFIAQDRNGVVRAIWRTSNPSASLETSLSTDGGKTWGPALKYTPVVGDNASTRAWLGTSPSGRTVLVYNNVAINRQALTVALSEDGGATYPHKMLLEAQPASSSYPWVVFGDSGEIFVFYDKGRSNAGFRKIICNKIIEDEVIAGTSIPVTTYVSDKGYVV